MNSDYEWFQLEAVDAWFFRDGYPFNAGEDQSARASIFPPHPLTVAGALRAALARGQGWSGTGSWPVDLFPVLGDGFEDLGSLSFQGPFLLRNGEFLFVLPQHVAGDTLGGDGTRTFEPVALLKPSADPITCDAGNVRLPSLPLSVDVRKRDKPPKPPEDFYVTCAGMTRILAGQLPAPEDCVPAEALYCLEPRIGIQRDAATHTTGDASMYAPRYVRLNPGVSIAAGIRGVPTGWSLPHVMPLGGESRLATCTPCSAPPALPTGDTSNNKANKAVLIALTPIRFDGDDWWGGGPNDNASRLAPVLQGHIVSAAINRPLGIGGWHFGHGPRPMVPHVAPGAVWWIDSGEAMATPADFLSLGDSTVYGFGAAVLGVWSETD